jgi:CheY-like chemotaxis protein
MARVLVVDDESQLRQLLCQALERRDHTVDQAADGREALQRLAEHQPDLVITDLVMPGMEGIETIQALRRRCPALPIIAISGGGRIDPENYLAIAGQMGANRTFAKPFRLEEILASVRELTEGAGSTAR